MSSEAQATPFTTPTGLFYGDAAALDVPHEGLAKELVETAKTVTVSDVESAEKASDLARRIKAVFNKIEDARKNLTAPLRAQEKSINGRFKSVADLLTTAEGDIKALLLAYQREEQRKADELRRQQAEAERKRQEEEQRKAEEARAAGQAPPPVAEPPPPPPVAEAPRTLRGEMGSVSSIRENWTYEVVDLSIVPFAYVQVNHAAVMEAVKKGGVREIAGLRIFNKGSVSIR